MLGCGPPGMGDPVWSLRTWQALGPLSITTVRYSLHFILTKGASGAGYQSSWGMGIKAAELVEHALRA
jgi:hypothetical protein